MLLHTKVKQTFISFWFTNFRTTRIFSVILLLPFHKILLKTKYKPSALLLIKVSLKFQVDRNLKSKVYMWSNWLKRLRLSQHMIPKSNLQMVINSIKPSTGYKLRIWGQKKKKLNWVILTLKKWKITHRENGSTDSETLRGSERRKI